MRISGIGFIYMITSPSGKIYIGSTIDIDQRWIRYKRLTCSHQTKLYRSLKKYGPENHVFEIIWAGELCNMYKYETLIGWGFNCLEKAEGLNCKLPKFGDTYSVFSDEIRLKISKSNKGFKHSNETKLKMSISGKGRIFTEEHKKNMSNSFMGRKLSQKQIDNLTNHNKNKMKSVLQYDLNNNFIKEWGSIMSIEKELGISKQSISQCCNNKIKTAGNFKWIFKNFVE